MSVGRDQTNAERSGFPFSLFFTCKLHCTPKKKKLLPYVLSYSKK
jgi:hypothetical protein